jgi:hypothetical protein
MAFRAAAGLNRIEILLIKSPSGRLGHVPTKNQNAKMEIRDILF